MKIKDLASTSFDEVISCFLSAFEGYFVKLPEDKNYWKKRFENARVDWELSYGMFDGEKLVGYIINAVDKHLNSLTAYNTGTGVLAEYRGRGIVDSLYEHALPLLKQHGIEKCLLEVICENKRAIKVYERIGFTTTRTLCTYTGSIPEMICENTLQKCHFSQALESGLYEAEHYSWDNTAEAVAMMAEETWCLGNNISPDAYLVSDETGNIVQLESKTNNFEQLLGSAAVLAKDVKIKNVDSERTELINTLKKWHFSNPVNQYEMEMFI
jgi:ribosomal protein S18 acetylase RimI-like enzyme